MEPVRDGNILRHGLEIPTLLEDLRQIGALVRDISCGVKHSAIVTTSSQLVLFGGNQFGQCASEETGLNAVVDELSYTNIGFDDEIEAVACGAAHTLVKTTDGKLFSFGLNDKG